MALFEKHYLELSLDTLHVIILALIQGLTEFLPISSSAHLILPSQLLGWPDQGLAFDVAVHVGTLCAVVFYFRNDLKLLIARWCQQFTDRGPTQESRLAWFIIAATVPACLFGLFFNEFIEHHLRSTPVIATTTIVFGLLLWLSDRRASCVNALTQMTLRFALIIGMAQALAMIPGTSRSGITITAALFLGFTRTDAARFSFLLSIPIIALSGAYEGFKLFSQTSVDWLHVSIGFGVAAISAYLCIYGFLSVINRLSMLPFVIYRLILGLLLFGFVYAV